MVHPWNSNDPLYEGWSQCFSGAETGRNCITDPLGNDHLFRYGLCMDRTNCYDYTTDDAHEYADFETRKDGRISFVELLIFYSAANPGDLNTNHHIRVDGSRYLALDTFIRIEEPIDFSDEAERQIKTKAPSRPMKLDASVEKSGEILLEWKPPRKDNGSPVTSYTIQYYNDLSPSKKTMIRTDSADTARLIPGLGLTTPPGDDTRAITSEHITSINGLLLVNNYVFSVAAENSNGLGDFSRIAKVTLSHCNDKKPADLRATHGADGSILLEWSGTGSGYDVSWAEADSEKYAGYMDFTEDGNTYYEIGARFIQSGTTYDILVSDRDGSCKYPVAKTVRVTAE